MPTEFKMPMLGEVMEEGQVVAWRKREGDCVKKGETIVVVDMAKAIMEVESPVSGIVKRILVPEGSIAAVNTTLAMIE